MNSVWVSLIWAFVVLYLARQKAALIKKELEPVATDPSDLETLSQRIALLELQADDLKKTADEAKRLMSNANLAMGFKSFGKRE